MLIRQVSDLHLEHHYDTFDKLSPAVVAKVEELIPSLPEDSESVMVIGGDIATIRKVERILTLLSVIIPRFKHVIYILGNHEHYGVAMDESFDILMKAIAENLSDECIKKLTVAGNDPVNVTIDGIRFLCGTLWTDYGKDMLKMDQIRMYVGLYITDHKVIRKSKGGVFSPQDLAEIHKATLEKFDEWLSAGDNRKTVVCTHHMPSFDAVHPKYATGDEVTRMLNHAFASDLNDFIKKHNPFAWTFGHTHTDYYKKLGNTLLVCNPHGYPKEGNAFSGVYTPFMRFEIT